jgi:long-chain fatty acid transport protein
MIWMQRTLTSDLATLNNSEFVGKLYVPVFPGVYAAYKTGNWTFSLGFNPPAGGGSVDFAKGLPMLENPISAIPAMLSGNSIPTSKYTMESMLKGSSIVYGVQVGATYKINDKFGVFGGVRMLFASNSYEGYLKNIKINPNFTGNPVLGSILDGTMIGPSELNSKGDYINGMAAAIQGSDPQTAALLGAVAGGLKLVASQIGDKSLDVAQKGSGFAPILGFHFQHNSLNLSAKYEFNAKVTLTNETKKDDVNMYPDKKELRSDVPAVLSLAGSYNILSPLKLSVTYIHHFQPQASIESWDATNQKIANRQDLIDGGTNEYMLGLEWYLTSKLTLSTGCQYSNVNVTNAWQNDIAHNLTNFTVGLGAAYHFNDRLTLNIGGLNTWYTPVTIEYTAPAKHKQTFDRSNKAIALGIDFRF